MRIRKIGLSGYKVIKKTRGRSIENPLTSKFNIIVVTVYYMIIINQWTIPDRYCVEQ